MFFNLVAPCNPLGYGVVGYNILKTLYNRGHTVSFFPIGQPQWDGDVEFQKFGQETINNNAFFNPEAPSLRIWHQNELAMFPGKGERIGWPIFELDRFDDRELHHLNSVDRLFVCSQWAKNVLEDNNVLVPVDVVPLAVDSNVFYIDEEAKRSRPYWTRDTTVFINIGKWEIRKGHKELIDAFCKAFTPEDNVELWMMNENPFIKEKNEDWKRLYIGSQMGAKIKIWPRLNTQGQLRAIFNQVDFGVFPSHAEGWNLEILELMACGTPCIATNYSGHTEYLNDSNSFLLEPNGKEVAQDGIWFHGQGNWCSYDVDQLVQLMRKLHNNRETIKTSLDLRSTVEKYSWDNSVSKIEEVLGAKAFA